MSTDIKKVDAKFGDPHSIARYFIKKQTFCIYCNIHFYKKWDQLTTTTTMTTTTTRTTRTTIVNGYGDNDKKKTKRKNIAIVSWVCKAYIRVNEQQAKLSENKKACIIKNMDEI